MVEPAGVAAILQLLAPRGACASITAIRKTPRRIAAEVDKLSLKILPTGGALASPAARSAALALGLI